ncbi:MAG: ABC transporter permease, partial [Clostridia bacterium]|nr:ABC transporter permease [Clostridia bacterium]
QYTSDIKYSYSTQLNIYNEDGYKVNPSNIFKEFGMTAANSMSESGATSGFMNTSVWQELLDNRELLENQYDVIAGNMPSSYDEVVLIVDNNNEISDYTLYTLGLMDIEELKESIKEAREEEKDVVQKTAITTYTYDEILNLKFKLLLNTDYYEKNDTGTYTDHTDDELYITKKLETAKEIKVAGILRAKSKSATSSASGTIGYLKTLMTELITDVNESEIVKAQKAKPEIDVITGLEFNEDKEYTMEDVKAYIASLPTEQQASYGTMAQQFKEQGMTDKQIVSKFSSYMKALSSDSTYENNLYKLGASDLNSPSSIIIYPKDFEAKESISGIIDRYNKEVNNKNKEISYTDYIGIMLSSVSTIINAISYILIAFVSISLIVSSIMIGIITYISVLERTKEIGVLRALGASKHDISRVFNAETIIEGFASGAIGIGITALLLIPINAIIESITDIAGLAILPTGGAIAL